MITAQHGMCNIYHQFMLRAFAYTQPAIACHGIITASVMPASGIDCFLSTGLQDDLDIQLDEPIAGLPPSIAQRPASQQVPPARQSSAGGAPHATQPGMPAVPGPRPPPGPPGTGLNPRPGVPPPRPPPGPPPLGHPAAPVMAPPPMPSQWPRPQFVHTGAGMLSPAGS